MNKIINLFFGNSALMSVVLGWFFSQLVKTIILFIKTKKFMPGKLFSTGGMPSAHTSSVIALTVSALMECGVNSIEFAISLVLSIIVMCDATGVRLQSGKHAKILNRMLEDSDDESLKEERLDESIGHTKLQVIVGGLVGGVVAFVYHLIISLV